MLCQRRRTVVFDPHCIANFVVGLKAHPHVLEALERCWRDFRHANLEQIVLSRYDYQAQVVERKTPDDIVTSGLYPLASRLPEVDS